MANKFNSEYENISIESIENALSFIEPNDREVWLRVGASLKDELGDNGFNIFNKWSSRATNYNEKDVSYTYEKSLKAGRVKIGSLFFEAIKNGYVSNEKRVVLSEEEKLIRINQNKERVEKLKELQIKKATEAKSKSNYIWGKSEPVKNHPYLEMKGISPSDNLQSIRVNNYKGNSNLVIPVYNQNEIVSLQFINEKGEKNFISDGELKGNYHLLGGEKKSEEVYLVEGFATGKSVHKATNKPVYVAFNAVNLVSVAETLSKELPSNTKVIVAGDNDLNLTGERKAKEALSFFPDRGKIMIPNFTENEIEAFKKATNSIPSDWNDVEFIRGEEAIKNELNSEKKFGQLNKNENINNNPMYKTEQLPIKDLVALGLFKDEKVSLDDKQTEKLLKGHLTDFVKLEDLKIDGKKISLDAKLSLNKKKDGSIGLFIHPIYNEMKTHPHLSTEEANQIAKEKKTFVKDVFAFGKIVDFGSAPYQNEKGNKESFFIKLEKANGEVKNVWGVDLKNALEESKHKIGDKIQLELQGKKTVQVDKNIINEKGEITGTTKIDAEINDWKIKDYQEENKKEKTFIYEYDDETKSFVAIDTDDVIELESVNGMKVTPEQAREFKEGRKVVLPDNTTVQASPKDGVISNRNLLVFSVLFDGGISYLLITLAKIAADKASINLEKEKEYSKGYLEALQKVKADLLQKQKAYPNNKDISKDLDIVGKEINNVSGIKVEQEPSINTFKEKVNDPELKFNAEKEQSYTTEQGQSIEQEETINRSFKR